MNDMILLFQKSFLDWGLHYYLVEQSGLNDSTKIDRQACVRTF